MEKNENRKITKNLGWINISKVKNGHLPKSTKNISDEEIQKTI